MLHVTLFYSTLPLSFPLFRFYFCLVTFLLCIYFTALYFALCFAFLILFSSLVYFVRALYLSTSSLSTWFILPYFALFSFHYIPVCFALLRFFTLPRFDFTSFRLAFLIFLGPVSAPVLTSSLPGDIARPSIPCSTCFVEPRAILLPLIPLCSVSREPRALEKSEPDWRRYVIYSPCRNETKRRPPFWFYAMHFNRGFNVATARFED